MSRYENLLFDADNTLFDFDRAEYLSFRLLLESPGFPADETKRKAEILRGRNVSALGEQSCLIDGAIAFGLDICRHNPDGKPDNGRKLTYTVKKLSEIPGILAQEV